MAALLGSGRSMPALSFPVAESNICRTIYYLPVHFICIGLVCVRYAYFALCQITSSCLSFVISSNTNYI